MAMRASYPSLDPAADAAALLRRIGFATLVFAVPAAALMARRATVVLVPIGTVLILIAAVLDRGSPGVTRGLRAALTSPAGVAALVLIGWAMLSILWTPFPRTATDKIINIAGVILLGAAGVASLPERMRAANLYLVPVGAGIAALLAIGLGGWRLNGGGGGGDGESLRRGLVVLVAAVWPALGWLVSRSRPALALALVGAVGAALLVATAWAAAVALAAGGFVYALATVRPRLAARLTAFAAAGALALAPLFPFVLRPFLKAFHGPFYPGATALRVWAEVMGREPLLLVTGHGLDASVRARLVGLLPAGAPQALPFEIWYELGVVGAFAAAALAALSVRAARRVHAPLLPSVLGAFTAGFVLTGFGAAGTQAWWSTALGAVVLTFVSVERGQFRTQRPKAVLSAEPEPAPRALPDASPGMRAGSP